jgi:transposase
MEVLYPHCAGLDVHKRSVVACVCHTDRRGHATFTTQTFETTTPALLTLQTWLTEHHVTHVAMEATGSYWKPVYNLLEGRFTTLVVNPAHMKNVAGRKTDVKDATWIADLLRHGLLAPSFIPDKPQRELRELTRQRTQWIAERSRDVNRIQKVLEGANIKLASVVTDVLGVSGRAMLDRLVAGETDPEILANLAVGRLRAKLDALLPALQGLMGDHQRFLLHQLLTHVDQLTDLIDGLDAEIARRVDEMEATIQRVCTIPGISRRTAEVIVAELGTDLTRFPDADHAAAWAGLAPGQNESAGKRKKTGTRRGNRALRQALTLAAWAASHTRTTFLGALYRRWIRRMPSPKAITALAHRLLIIVYQVMTTGEPYHELGSTYHDDRDRTHIVQQAVRRLQRLGYHVILESTDSLPTTG